MSSQYGEPSGLDKFYRDNFAVAIVLAVCCGIVALILEIIVLTSGKDPVAKKNAKTALIIQLVLAGVGILFQVVMFIIAAVAGGR
jgi:hypothetical protein